MCRPAHRATLWLGEISHGLGILWRNMTRHGTIFQKTWQKDRRSGASTASSVERVAIKTKSEGKLEFPDEKKSGGSRDRKEAIVQNGPLKGIQNTNTKTKSNTTRSFGSRLASVSEESPRIWLKTLVLAPFSPGVDERFYPTLRKPDLMALHTFISSPPSTSTSLWVLRGITPQLRRL